MAESLVASTAERKIAVEELRELAAGVEPESRGIAFERLAEAEGRLGNAVGQLEALANAVEAYRASAGHRSELRMLLLLAETTIRRGPGPERASVELLRAAYLARSMNDESALDRIERTLTAWAAESSRSADLRPRYRGAIDRFPFRGNLSVHGGELVVSKTGMLYLVRHGAEHGLARFDGSFLEPLELPVEGWVRSLVALPDGRLVCGTDAGALLGDGDGWRPLAVPDATGVVGSDGEDGFWVAVPGGGVRFGSDERESDRVDLPPLAGQSDEIGAFLATTKGHLYVVSKAGVRVFRGRESDPLPSSEDSRRVVEDRDGSVWVLSTTGADRYREGLHEEFVSPAGSAGVRSLIRGSDGSLWMGLGSGVARRKEGSLGLLTDSGDLFEQVYGLVEWGGERWIMNQFGGLVRIGQPRVETFGRRWLPSGWVYRIESMSEGRLLLGTGGGAALFDPISRQVLHFADEDHCPEILPGLLVLSNEEWFASSHVANCVTRHADGVATAFRSGKGLPEGSPYALGLHGGQACVAMSSGVFCYDGRQWLAPPELGDLAGMASTSWNGLVGDREGNLIVSIDGHGAWRMAPPGSERLPVRLEDSLLEPDARAIDTGREILIRGTGGLLRWVDGQLHDVPGVPRTTQDVYRARHLKDGSLLLSVFNQGLIVSDGEDAIRLGEDDGLPSLRINAIEETESGIWLGTGGSGLVSLRWNKGDPPETFVVADGWAYFRDADGESHRLGVSALRAQGEEELSEGPLPEGARRLESTAGLFWMQAADSLALDSPNDSLIAGLPIEEATLVKTLRSDRIEFRVAAITPRRGLGSAEHLYRYRIDDGDWQLLPGGTELVLEGLRDGLHSLEVRAKGHLLTSDPTPSRLLFEVDTPLPIWFWGALAGFFVALGMWRRRELRWTWLALRHLQYREIPVELFTSSAPVTDRALLLGRRDILDELERSRRQGACFIIWAGPGHGATSLVGCIAPPSDGSMLVLDLELLPVFSVEVLLRVIIGDLGGRLAPEERPTLALDGLELGAYDEHSHRSPFQTFERQFRASIADRRIHLVFDNADRLHEIACADPTHGNSLLPFLARLVASTRGLTLILTLSGDRSVIEHAYRDLFLISTVLVLDPLSRADSLRLLEERAQGAILFSPRAADACYRMSGGRPGSLLRIGRELARRLGRGRRGLARSVDVEKVAGDLVASGGHSAKRWERLSPRTRLVLSLLAELGPGVSADSLAEIAESHEVPILEQELRRAVADLLWSGDLVIERHSLILAADLFRLWITLHKPFDRIAAESNRTIATYQILDTLGQGGMGVVYKARDMVTGEICALKMMARHLLTSADGRKRFLREAEVGMRLRHPSIVRILARGEHEGRAFLAMELIEGESLRSRISRQRTLPWREAVEIALALADALAEVHDQGIVHRDVKSDNVMMLADGRPKLMDFGLVFGADWSILTGTGQLLGTMPYMSPEQIDGGEVSASWDLYALGIVLYEMLTGRPPFSHRQPIALFRAITAERVAAPPGLPPKLAELVQRLLAKEPSHRFVSARALVDALEILRA